MDACNLQHHLQKSKNGKNHRSILEFWQIFSIFLEKLRFCEVCSWKKNPFENPEKKKEKTPKNRENRKKAPQIFRFSEIFFQSFRKSYVLVPSHGGKNGDENPEKTLREGFSGNRRKNIQKIGKRDRLYDQDYFRQKVQQHRQMTLASIAQ